MMVVALLVGLALLMAETLLIALAPLLAVVLLVTAALLKAGPVEAGVAHLLQPVKEAHRDAAPRRRARVSVSHGCREAKRVTGRAEEEDGYYGDLHGRDALQRRACRHESA